jgi:hypothetical protein
VVEVDTVTWVVSEPWHQHLTNGIHQPTPCPLAVFPCSHLSFHCSCCTSTPKLPFPLRVCTFQRPAQTTPQNQYAARTPGSGSTAVHVDFLPTPSFSQCTSGLREVVSGKIQLLARGFCILWRNLEGTTGATSKQTVKGPGSWSM